MKVVGRRVDGLTLAFRVTLDPAFVEQLRERGRIAHKHGRAAFEWVNRVPEGMNANGSRDDRVGLGGLRARWADESPLPVEHKRAVWGELKFSRAAKVWNITNEPYFRMRVDEQAPGSVDRIDDVSGEFVHEGGWTIEIVFYAQWLADVGLDAALREADAIASLCGEVHEKRLRRADLCADIEGWAIKEDDVRHLVKRPRARWQKEYGDVAIGSDGVARALPPSQQGAKKERAEEVRAQDFGRGALERRQITGLSVGRGGAMMSRIYDKRVELERDDARRAVEEARWKAEGWDGKTCVTRIEFQIRGAVIGEFGLRDPERALDVETALDDRGRVRVVGHRVATDEDGCVLGLVDRLDWLWRSCLDWVRLVKLERTAGGRLKPASRLPDDERWAFLRTVAFASARAPHPIKRFRVRAAASAAMGLGVALAQAGRDGQLERLEERSGAYDEETALELLRARVEKLKSEEAARIVDMLLTRGGGAIGACVHYAVRNNAALVRFMGRRSDADLSTGPPHGHGPRPPPPPQREGDDSRGSREAGRAVA